MNLQSAIGEVQPDLSLAELGTAGLREKIQPLPWGIEAERRALDAIHMLQADSRTFHGFRVAKAARTCDHKRGRIRKLDGRKVDILVVFSLDSVLASPSSIVLAIQVKSSEVCYRKFCRRYGKVIKCVFVPRGVEIEKLMRELDNLFNEVLAIGDKRNPYLRPRIPIELI